MTATGCVPASVIQDSTGVLARNAAFEYVVKRSTKDLRNDAYIIRRCIPRMVVGA